MRVKSARRVTLSVFLATLLILMSATVGLAALVDPGAIGQYSWDPDSAQWNGGKGENSGYREGETAIMVAEIVRANLDPSVSLYELPICLQAWEVPQLPKIYRFTKFEPFDTSFAQLQATGRAKPTTLPSGEVLNFASGGALVYGHNINIVSVTPIPLGGPECGDANYFGVVVQFTMPSTDISYLLWGGHLAKQGDTAADGVTIPYGQSASWANGVFQGRLKTAAADKTLPFKVLSGPTAVVLSGMTASAGVPVFGLALVALLVLAGGVFGLKRLQAK